MSVEDIAQAVELRQWEANNRSRGAVVRFAPGDPGYGPEFCAVDVCGADIPAKRREWGFTTCFSCATMAEQQAKHARR